MVLAPVDDGVERLEAVEALAQQVVVDEVTDLHVDELVLGRDLCGEEPLHDGIGVVTVDELSVQAITQLGEELDLERLELHADAVSVALERRAHFERCIVA